MLQVQGSKASDAVGALNFGVVVNGDGSGAHDCGGDRTVVAMNLVEVMGIQNLFSGGSGPLVLVVSINSVVFH